MNYKIPTLGGLSAARDIAMQYHHVFHIMTLLTNLALLLIFRMPQIEQLEEHEMKSGPLNAGCAVKNVKCFAAVALQGEDDLGGGGDSSHIISFHIHSLACQ
jgi:hypothetical protein